MTNHQNLLLNSQFKSWGRGEGVAATDGAGTMVCDRWLCKYTLSNSSCTVSPASEFDGGAVLSFSCDDIEHFYLRQYVPGLQQFSGRKCTVIADVETVETDLLYDWYIVGRYNDDANDRIAIVDAANSALASGRNLVSKTFDVPVINASAHIKDIQNAVSVAFRVITQGAKSGSVTVHSVSFVYGESTDTPYCDPDYEDGQLKQFYEKSEFTTGVGGLEKSAGQKRVFFPFTAQKRLGILYGLKYKDAAGNPDKVSVYNLNGVRTDNVTPTAVSKRDAGFILIINNSSASGIGCSWEVDSDFLV